MNQHTNGPSISQKIFSMNLGVEAVSLYLLCCAVADTGSAVTKEALADKWNGSADALDRELAFLEEKNILRPEEGEENASYRIMEEKRWV